MPISEITPNLYVTSRNETGNLKDYNFDLVINAVLFSFPKKSLRSLDIPILNVPSIDSPLIPMPMWVFKKSVKTALPIIKNNGKVLVYCLRGAHRSVAIATCILIALGYSSDDAMKLVSTKRDKADPYMFHIKSRIIKFEKYFKNHEQEFKI